MAVPSIAGIAMGTSSRCPMLDMLTMAAAYAVVITTRIPNLWIKIRNCQSLRVRIFVFGDGGANRLAPG